ncbi:hypothetical protein COO60DRAFT_1456951 [Scenedesmus sp. NREL 46B-D3]|nr:hypothetical protein COO60DRAFT_1456951 [Scenedesmus sp. NREL 46B-D3]
MGATSSLVFGMLKLATTLQLDGLCITCDADLAALPGIACGFQNITCCADWLQDPTLMKATMLRRIGIIQEAAAIVLARSKACENRYQSVSQLAHKVLVQERKQLFAAEQAYMRNEDAMREHACAAEHSAAQGQATTSQGFATLQAAEQAAGTSQAAAASLLVEDVLAEVARARVFIRAMQQRRLQAWHLHALLQMSWALSRPDAEQLQRLCRALKQPGMLQAEAEEHAYALVLRQLRDIQKCNKQLSASTIKHAAARTYKDKRRAHLAKSLHASADVQQQQHLEECKTPTMRTELVGKLDTARCVAYTVPGVPPRVRTPDF